MAEKKLEEITERIMERVQPKIRKMHVTMVNCFHDRYGAVSKSKELKNSIIKDAPSWADVYIIGYGITSASGRRRGGTLYHTPILYMAIDK